MTPSDYQFKSHRILIWGKTYPELSRQYEETVCTGGILEDGRPVRLYPIPLRYLEEENQFSKYQYITADIAKSPEDPRPESYKIRPHSIVPGDKIPTNGNWEARSDILFQYDGWQFDSVEELMEHQREEGTSIGVVMPKEIMNISVYTRPDADRIEFKAKRDMLQKQRETKSMQVPLFGVDTIPNLMDLAYISQRVVVNWRCSSGTHRMQIYDWEVIEFQRKFGIGAALERVQQIINLDTYDIRFFLGNFRLYPNRFGIVGLWYPKQRDQMGMF